MEKLILNCRAVEITKILVRINTNRGVYYNEAIKKYLYL
jgi:hypothetical protein